MVGIRRWRHGKRDTQICFVFRMLPLLNSIRNVRRAVGFEKRTRNLPEEVSPD